MNFVEHGLQTHFESLVFSTLIELADEMAACLERFIAELQCSIAEVLQ
jgi:hypothetical protein